MRDAAGPPEGVSFVVPVRNGEAWLDATLRAIVSQADGRPMEVIAVDDGSADGSARILAEYTARGSVRVVAGRGRGAAAAVNLGLTHARYPTICQVDQDVVLEPGWMARLTATLADPGVAAVQGYYVTPWSAGVWARVAGLDLEQRYARIAGPLVDHVCTGNTAYRRDALRGVGGLDERIGYGYDNDLSYRLVAAGHRLVFCRDARAVHRWRDRARGYLRQQYGLAYGRFDVVAKHPRRLTGDDVSGPGMLLHVVGMTVALPAVGVGSALVLAGESTGVWLVRGGLAILAGLLLERTLAGVRATYRFGDAAGLLFPIAHLLRDVAWATALVRWLGRRLIGQPARPEHSMTARESTE
jgi:GT2 family glycosyltransferase